MTSARRFVFAVWITAVAIPLLGVAPNAAAHCDLGFQTGINNLVHQLTGQDPGICFNTPLELAIEKTNAALYGEGIALAYIEYERFHPEVVHIPSGGRLLVLWADVEEGTLPAVKHTITSSGPCLDAAADPEADAKSCVASDPGLCFDSEVEIGVIPWSGHPAYDLRLSYDAAAGQVRHTAPWPGKAVSDCPEGTGINGDGQSVIPYHCKYHGVPRPNARPGYDLMRGTVIVDAPVP